MDRTIDIDTIPEGTRGYARQIAAFQAALLAEGFESSEAVRIVAAWVGRPEQMTAADYDAVMQNMVSGLTGEAV